ncbi:TetR family transcriptional regulator [Streptomyces lincolnensis]|uniref:TetR family transcriptional regulator n=1 Tax=Streptomyces lincolnensis TaxID=1915 RepID=UPI0037D77C1D
MTHGPSHSLPALFRQIFTLEVQRRAGVSRGALLHHFPTLEELLGAAVARLVERNEEAVRKELAAVEQDPVGAEEIPDGGGPIPSADDLGKG